MARYISILGRQPDISLAELECLYGSDALERLSSGACIFEAKETPNIQQIGGSLKIGKVLFELRSAAWHDLNTKVIRHYTKQFASSQSKITLGISVYDWSISPRDIQKLGLTLKRALKSQSVSLRLIPNVESVLSTATSHHNKLGLSPTKIELLVARTDDGSVVVAESLGAQNITALAARDQGRPKRDAFVGMLPPKLALMMVNMARPTHEQPLRLLDPFCGTGVVLQEAALLGYDVYGTDLSDKMIDYSQVNLEWIKEKYHLSAKVDLAHGDAIDTQWQPPIDAVVCETYLGQPFSAPPAPDKLIMVQRVCNEIISKFLTNLHPQIKAGTPLCVAVPAWRDTDGNFSHLSLINKLDSLGYSKRELHHTQDRRLLYYREDQVVARELLLLTRA
jgi:tRNA G10  N-methylase Trm11